MSVNDKMHILVLNFEYPPLGGGASPIGKQISEAYAANGHKVSVVTTHFDGLPALEKDGDVEIYRIKSGRKKKNISYPNEHLIYLIKARSVIRAIHRKDFIHACHCHFILPTGVLAYWCKSRLGIPYVITIHGSDVPAYNPDRFGSLHILLKPALKFIVKHAYAIVSPSDYLAGLLKNTTVPSRLERINYGYQTQYGNEVQKEKIILSTGRLLPRKGFQHLIKAVAAQDLGYEVHICGDGPMRAELENLAQSSATKIVFHGWINNQSPEYRSLLAKASIFVLVSSQENSSLSIMEAMENKCAIISSNTTGCFEMVHDIGICVPPGEVDPIRKAILQLVENEGQINTMGDLAHKKLEHNYSVVESSNKYIDLLMNAQVVNQ